jgi:hypothetical protein
MYVQDRSTEQNYTKSLFIIECNITIKYYVQDGSTKNMYTPTFNNNELMFIVTFINLLQLY